MLEQAGLDVVSVLLDYDLHHTVAEDCFAAGVHVQMQKLLVISPSFGRKMLADAAKYDRVLTLAEPSALGAGNVAMARAIRDGIIGSVYMIMDYATVTLGRKFFAGTAWRHMKGRAGAGWINDHGVHRTHFFTEVNGPIKEVFSYANFREAAQQRGNDDSSDRRRYVGHGFPFRERRARTLDVQYGRTRGEHRRSVDLRQQRLLPPGPPSVP